MKDILFSSWAGEVIDNRDGSDGSTADSNVPKEIRMPNNLNEAEPIKAFMGWDGFVLCSEDVHVVDLCRAYMEAVRNQSCGKCIPCRVGTFQISKMLDKIISGKGNEEDIIKLEELCKLVNTTSLCGLGISASNPVISTLKNFREEYNSLLQPTESIEAGAS